MLIAKNEDRYIREWLEYHRMVGIDHFYIDEISVSDPNLLSVILAELPKMIFTHMHSFPDILSYYPMPLPHEQHQSKTQSIVEKVAKLTQAVIAEQLINGQYDTNKPHLVLTEEQRRIITGMLRRSTKANHHKGSYSYTVRQLGTENGYFFVDRHIFGRLVPRQMLIYLFLCKSFSTELNICWNSYNDIAAQTGMKRELVIQTVNELADMHLIVRMKRKARDCSRVFIDNHYQIVFFVRGRIRKREKCATVSQLRSHRLRDA